MKVLVATSGPMRGEAYPIAGRTLIGRDGECDIQVVDRHASRRHACVLELDDGTVLLRDLKSQNGTLLRGERVKEAVLEPGDEIGIGASRFELRIMDDDEAQAHEPGLRLTSGPALAATLTASLPLEDQAKISARARTGGEAMPSGAASACCPSPLAARARAEGWLHCPACGAKLRT